MSLNETIEHAARVVGVSTEIQALRDAAEWSEGRLTDAQSHIQNLVSPDKGSIDVLVLGSYARAEASTKSDFDYLIVPHELPPPSAVKMTRELLAAVDQFIEMLGKLALDDDDDQTDRKPGATGLFGQIQSAPDLVERIGLEQDTNSTHTRRSLVLQESRSIFRPDLHEALLRSVLARYLSDYHEGQKAGPPRFLINDLNRYWYTVAVDYQAKRWERLERGWRIRYLKLLVSRRLSYVGAVIPLLLCSDARRAEVDRLVMLYQQPPLARIADLVNYEGFEEGSELATVLRVANVFIDTLRQAGNRKILEEVATAVALFDELKALTNELDAALRKIFFGSLLREQSMRYLLL